MEETLDTELCCPICLDNSNSQNFIRPCSTCVDTYIHKECFNRMINYNLRTCPTCRSPYGINNHIIIDIEPIVQNFNLQQFDYESNFSYSKYFYEFINNIFLLIIALYFVGCLGGMLLAIINPEAITFNPFSKFFILQIIFGSFIALLIVSLFDSRLMR